ncbi:MAG: hypothetical protein ABL867_04845 [Rickettsiales bacterium]
MSRYYNIYTIAYSPKVTAVLFFIGIALIISDYTFCRKKIKKIEQTILSGTINTQKEILKLRGKIQLFENWQYLGWAFVGMAALNLDKLIRYG